jgi:hypothetical protein
MVGCFSARSRHGPPNELARQLDVDKMSASEPAHYATRAYLNHAAPFEAGTCIPPLAA